MFVRIHQMQSKVHIYYIQLVLYGQILDSIQSLQMNHYNFTYRNSSGNKILGQPNRRFYYSQLPIQKDQGNKDKEEFQFWESKMDEYLFDQQNQLQESRLYVPILEPVSNVSSAVIEPPDNNDEFQDSRKEQKKQEREKKRKPKDTCTPNIPFNIFRQSIRYLQTAKMRKRMITMCQKVKISYDDFLNSLKRRLKKATYLKNGMLLRWMTPQESDPDSEESKVRFLFRDYFHWYLESVFSSELVEMKVKKPIEYLQYKNKYLCYFRELSLNQHIMSQILSGCKPSSK